MGLQILPNRFGQQLCYDLVVLAEMDENLDLCRRATERSLELTEGVVNESTAYNVPIGLAAMSQTRGDDEEALKLYKLGIDSVKLAYTHTFADVFIYQSAKLQYTMGHKEDALRTIGAYHSAFLGPEPPYLPPAHNLSVEFANKIATDLGYPDAETGVSALLGL